MHRHVEIELQELKEQILAMGGHVELAIEEATRALLQKQPERLRQVEELEFKINREHCEVDEACIRLLARQSPMAKDLRLVVAVMKINTDLERMGDQAINIAHNAREYLANTQLLPLHDIPQMAKEVRAMVRNALDAFVNQDQGLAEKVLQADDQVDAMKDKVFKEMTQVMTKEPKMVEQALNLILIARNMERLGDHATNVAEDVIYAVSGEDIRHGSNSQP